MTPDGLFGSLTAVVGGQAVVAAAPAPPAPPGPPAVVINQIISDLVLVPVLRTPSGAAFATQAFNIAFMQSMMQSAQQTQMLVVDEIVLMIDLVSSARGANNQSDIANLETAISQNPVYSSPFGYATGLLAGAMTLNALL